MSERAPRVCGSGLGLWAIGACDVLSCSSCSSSVVEHEHVHEDEDVHEDEYEDEAGGVVRLDHVI
jgi:hypothetical protein